MYAPLTPFSMTCLDMTFSQGNSLEIVKSRAIELCSLLSRTAIERGAPTDSILKLNNHFLQNLQSIQTMGYSVLQTAGNRRNIYGKYVSLYSNQKQRDHQNVLCFIFMSTLTPRSRWKKLQNMFICILPISPVYLKINGILFQRISEYGKNRRK